MRLLTCFMLLYSSLLAQSDSYQVEVKRLKVEAHNARFSDTELASKLLMKGLRLSQKNNNEVDIGYFYRKLISEKGNAQQLDSAEFYFKKGIQFYLNIRKTKGKGNMEDVLLQAHLHSELAEAYSANFNFERSYKEYTKALKYYTEFDDYIGIGISKINIGNLSLKQSNFPEAISIFLESKDIFDTTEYHYITAETCYGISTAYEKMLNLNQAIDYAQLYLDYIKKSAFEAPGVINAQIYLSKLYAKNGNHTKMEHFLSKAQVGIDSLELNYFLPAIATVESIDLIKRGEYEAAKVVLTNAEKYVDESKVDPMQIFEFKHQLSKTLLNTGEKKRAQHILENVLELVESLNLYQEGIQITLTLTEMYEEEGENKAALLMLKKHQEYYKHSIGLEQQVAFKEIEAKYLATKQRNQLLKQNVQLLEQKRTIEEGDWNMKRNQLFIIILILLLVITAISYFLFVRNLRAKKEKELHAQELKSSQEKLRISRDLHDNIGAELTLIKSKIDQRIFLSKDKTEIAVMSEISDYSKQAMDELRKTIWATKSNEIFLSELEAKLDAFVNRFSIEYSLKSNFTDRKISALVGLNIYRVAQEAIQNAMKHSEAHLLTIEISDSINDLSVISIRDNGKGFDVNAKHKGYGIESMKARMEEIGGDLQIKSSEHGSFIQLRF